MLAKVLQALVFPPGYLRGDLFILSNNCESYTNQPISCGGNLKVPKPTAPKGALAPYLKAKTGYAGMTDRDASKMSTKHPTGLEPATFCLEGKCSIQLS